MLKWDVYVKTLSRTISVNLATLSRSQSFLNPNELSKKKKKKVQPPKDYALSIGGNWNEYSKNIIFRLQKRAAWIVTGNFWFYKCKRSRYYEWVGVANFGPKKK